MNNLFLALEYIINTTDSLSILKLIILKDYLLKSE